MTFPNPTSSNVKHCRGSSNDRLRDEQSSVDLRDAGWEWNLSGSLGINSRFTPETLNRASFRSQWTQIVEVQSSHHPFSTWISQQSCRIKPIQSGRRKLSFRKYGFRSSRREQRVSSSLSSWFWRRRRQWAMTNPIDLFQDPDSITY